MPPSGRSKGKAKYESGREELPANKGEVYLAPRDARFDVCREENGYRYAEVVRGPYGQGRSHKRQRQMYDKLRAKYENFKLDGQRRR